MNHSTAITLKRTDVITFLVLVTVASLAPLAGNQFVSGTIVNCMLITAVLTGGVRSGLLVGIIPSTIALATGLLPAALAPMVPFIILGNAVLVIFFDFLRKYNYWLGAVAGAVLKFGLLSGTVAIVTGLIVNETAAANVAYMMSWPQLVTALAGSLAAFGITQLKRGINKARPQLASGNCPPTPRTSRTRCKHSRSTAAGTGPSAW